MRSAAAMADCITVYLALRSRTGMKNLFMYSMKATTSPTVSPALTLLVPYFDHITRRKNRWFLGARAVPAEFQYLTRF